MVRILSFRFKSHHYAQMLSALLFLIVLNFQNCSRVKLAPVAASKAPAKIAQHKAKLAEENK